MEDYKEGIQRTSLKEISIYRPLLILCILIGHCFAVYSGAWEKPEYIIQVAEYKYINPIFISFQLAAFAFISGYLAAYKEYKILEKGFLLKKIQRLIIPSIVFSTLYYFLFKYQGDSSIGICRSALYILNGSGHLWFLPMLFWCFVFLWVIQKFKVNPLAVISLFLLVFISPIPSYRIPLGIGKAIYYFPFFYFGFLVWKWRKFSVNNDNVWIVVSLSMYIASMLLKYFYFNKYEDDVLILILGNIVELICLSAGTYMMYLIIVKICHYIKKMPKVLLLANRYSYAVYVIHQFVLLLLVYDVTYRINQYIIPFLWLFITLLLSSLLSVVLLKTKLGKILLG